MKRRPRAPASRGFTMLELLVAFVILALSLGMLYRASGGSARSVGDVERYQRALVLADSLLQLRDAVPAQGWSQSGESAGYRWRISSTPHPTAVDAGNPNVPVLHEISIIVAWPEGDAMRQIALNTLRPERKPPSPGRTP